MKYSYLSRTNTVATRLLVLWEINIEMKCLVNDVAVNANTLEIFTSDIENVRNRAFGLD